MTLMHVPVIDIAPYRTGDRAAARAVASRWARRAATSASSSSSVTASTPPSSSGWTSTAAPSSICRSPTRCAWRGPRPT